MSFEERWAAIREAADDHRDEVLRTPASDRRFTVEAVTEAGVAVAYRGSDQEQFLTREQFETLVDRLESPPREFPLRGLSPRVEPYVTVLSLHDRYRPDEEQGLLRVHEGPRAENPLVVGPRQPTEVEEVRADAVLLVDLLERHGDGGLDALPTEALVNCYVALSEVQRGADDLRREVGEHLLDRIGPEGSLSADLGTVTRTTRERRRLKDDETVLDVLDEYDIPEEWVLGVVAEKLDVVLAVTDVEPAEVYDLDEQVYVQKTGVDEAAKADRLADLRERLADLESAEAEEVREELAELESRIEGLLAD